MRDFWLFFQIGAGAGLGLMASLGVSALFMAYLEKHTNAPAPEEKE